MKNLKKDQQIILQDLINDYVGNKGSIMKTSLVLFFVFLFFTILMPVLDSKISEGSIFLGVLTILLLASYLTLYIKGKKNHFYSREELLNIFKNPNRMEFVKENVIKSTLNGTTVKINYSIEIKPSEDFSKKQKILFPIDSKGHLLKVRKIFNTLSNDVNYLTFDS